jgi:hypothetical protein
MYALTPVESLRDPTSREYGRGGKLETLARSCERGCDPEPVEGERVRALS